MRRIGHHFGKYPKFFPILYLKCAGFIRFPDHDTLEILLFFPAVIIPDLICEVIKTHASLISKIWISS